MRIPLLTTVLLACTAGLAAQGLTLDEVSRLARERSERQRPAQEKALEPYLPSLELDAEVNQSNLQTTYDEIAALGDAIVPLLLDHLSPERFDERSTHLATNCARVLSRLDPSSFADTLLELAGGDNPVARSQAIYLLGFTDDPRAAPAIAAMYGELQRRDMIRALDTLGRLGSPAVAAAAAGQLAAADDRLRGHILDYLNRTRAHEVWRDVLVAFRKNDDHRLTEDYVRYFGASVRGQAEVADALLPLAAADRRRRLDVYTEQLLFTVLGTIAPPGHARTMDVLREPVERGETSSVAVAAAVSLRRLGDKKVEKTLFDNLERRIRKRRDDSRVYVDRATAYQAFEDWRRAIADYESAIKHARVESEKNLYWLQIAICEAHRDRATHAARALRESGVGLYEIRKEAERDAVFAAILETEAVQRFLRSLR